VSIRIRRPTHELTDWVLREAAPHRKDLTQRRAAGVEGQLHVVGDRRVERDLFTR
jgi:hypothetical protein